MVLKVAKNVAPATIACVIAGMVEISNYKLCQQGEQQLSFKKALFLIFVVNSGNLASYFCQLICARIMSTDEYGLFNALNSLGVLFASLFPVVVILVVRIVVNVMETQNDLLKPTLNFLLKKGLIVAATSFIVGMILSPFIKKFFHIINEPLPLYILIAGLSISILLPVLAGFLQGMGLYVMQSAVIAMYTWGRFGFISLFSLDGKLSVSGAIFAGVISTTLTLLIAYKLITINLNGKSSVSYKNATEKTLFSSSLKEKLKKDAIFSAFVYLLIAIFFNGDIIVARHFLSPHDVGLYSVAAVIARIGFYLPGILIAILFSESAKNTIPKTLIKVSILSGIICISFTAICWMLPKILIKYLMGIKYVEASSLLRIISVGICFFTLANIFYTYLMGKGKYEFLSVFVLSGILSFGLIFLKFHSSSAEIALCLTGGNFLAFIGGCGFLIYSFKARKC